MFSQLSRNNSQRRLVNLRPEGPRGQGAVTALLVTITSIQLIWVVYEDVLLDMVPPFSTPSSTCTATGIRTLARECVMDEKYSAQAIVHIKRRCSVAEPCQNGRMTRHHAPRRFVDGAHGRSLAVTGYNVNLISCLSEDFFPHQAICIVGY